MFTRAPIRADVGFAQAKQNLASAVHKKAQFCTIFPSPPGQGKQIITKQTQFAGLRNEGKPK
jgi:hypothetical protein